MKWISIAVVIGIGSLYSSMTWADLAQGEIEYRRGNYASAIHEWRPLAEQGNAQAQFRIAMLYLEGRGTQQDYAQAAEWFEVAAEQGVAPAQNNLGSLYETGFGVTQDYVQAVDLYRRAAEQGDAYAQNNLGVMYAQGRGTDRNHAWAVFWFSLAVQSGNELAFDNLQASLPYLEEGQISGSRVNVRAGASIEHEVIASMERGAPVRILGRTDDWAQVYLEEGNRLGWISSSLLE